MAKFRLSFVAALRPCPSSARSCAIVPTRARPFGISHDSFATRALSPPRASCFGWRLSLLRNWIVMQQRIAQLGAPNVVSGVVDPELRGEIPIRPMEAVRFDGASGDARVAHARGVIRLVV